MRQPPPVSLFDVERGRLPSGIVSATAVAYLKRQTRVPQPRRAKPSREERAGDGELREKLRVALGFVPCPHCGHVPRLGYKRQAQRLGMPPGSLHAFLAGRSLRPRLRAKVKAFLEAEVAP